MNSTFIIQPPKVDTTSADLYIEIKPQGLSYVIIDNNNCVALATFHFKAGIPDDLVARHIHELVEEQPILQEQFKQVHIIYGYSQSVLVPHELMNESTNRDMLELIFGDATESMIRTDYLFRHQIHNVYSVPTVIDAAISRHFDTATHSHLYSLLPDVIQESSSYLYCIFNTGQLTVLLKKDGQLQVIQNYAYKVPEDVAYHLLNTCKSFEVLPDDAIIHLSGMIDAASPLYSELYKYFRHIFFEGLPEKFGYPENINKYPSHYFSHLFAIAACV